MWGRRLEGYLQLRLQHVAAGERDWSWMKSNWKPDLTISLQSLQQSELPSVLASFFPFFFCCLISIPLSLSLFSLSASLHLQSLPLFCPYFSLYLFLHLPSPLWCLHSLSSSRPPAIVPFFLDYLKADCVCVCVCVHIKIGVISLKHRSIQKLKTTSV